MFIYVLPYQLTQKYVCLGQVKADITYLYLSALMVSSLAELGISNTLATDLKLVSMWITIYAIHSTLSPFFSHPDNAFVHFVHPGICRIMLRKVKITDIFISFLTSRKKYT